MVHVLSVVIDIDDTASQAISRLGASQGTLYELPTCPVCLERMDSAITGLITVPCSHTFHCMCLSKWGDSRFVLYSLVNENNGLTFFWYTVAQSVVILKHFCHLILPLWHRHIPSPLRTHPLRTTLFVLAALQLRISGYVSSVATLGVVDMDKLMLKLITKARHIYTLWNWRLSVYGTMQATDMFIA